MEGYFDSERTEVNSGGRKYTPMYAQSPAKTHIDGIDANSKNQDLTPMRYGIMNPSR
jgi:hypothetical protein